jgi:hypothetical protein
VQHVADWATDAFGDAALAAAILHGFVVPAYLRGEPYLVPVANTDTPLGVADPELRRDFKVQPIWVVDPVPAFGGPGVFA